MEEIQITSKFALLTTAEYIKLNHALSVAKGYDLEKDTARCFPIVPQLAKVGNLSKKKVVQYHNTVSKFICPATL